MSEELKHDPLLNMTKQQNKNFILDIQRDYSNEKDLKIYLERKFKTIFADNQEINTIVGVGVGDTVESEGSSVRQRKGLL